jgi:F-type H+-transporting ATPase subunit delta
MLIWEVAGKYASALFMAVKERDLVTQADEQFLVLKQLVTQDRSLLNFLTAPQVPDEDKRQLIESVFGPRMHRLLVQFLLVLVEKGRISFLPEIIEEFDRQVKADQGVGIVTAITAVPMIDSEVDALRSKLAAKTGLKIELTRKVDPDILGGMIVVMHDSVIDGSVRRGLDLLEDQLEKVKVH